MTIVKEEYGVKICVNSACSGMPPEYRVIKEVGYCGKSYAQLILLKYKNAIAVLINGEDKFHGAEFFREFCVKRDNAQVAKCDIHMSSNPNTDNSHAQAQYAKEHEAFLKKQISFKGVEALEHGAEIYKSIIIELNKGVNLPELQRTVFEGIGDILDDAHKNHGIE